MKKPAVILDRDGTIIIDKIYLNDPDQIEYLPDVEKALKLLQDNGFALAVATNQSGIPRGLVQLENLHEIHRRIDEHFRSHGVEICGFYYAPYMTDSGHPMRKPDDGMLQAAAKEHNFDLSRSWMIGDKITDVQAGHKAGSKSILLAPETPTEEPQPEGTFANLLEAAHFILEHSPR